jgi:hypothetical protein
MKTETVLLVGLGGALAYALWKRRQPAPANPIDDATGLAGQATGLLSGAVGALSGLLGELGGGPAPAGGGTPVAGGIQPLPKPPERSGLWGAITGGVISGATGAVVSGATGASPRLTNKPCCDGCAQTGSNCGGASSGRVAAALGDATAPAHLSVIAPSLGGAPVAAPSRRVLMAARARA